MIRRKSVRFVIAYILIAVGAFFVLFAVCYEASGYPWRVLFTDPSELNIDRMADPTPPDIYYVKYHSKSPDVPSATNNPSAVPSLLPSATPSREEPLPGHGDGYFNTDGMTQPEVSYPPVVLLGAVKIPKLDISVNLVEGTSARDLLAGAGHVSSTPPIGCEGNVVVAGHRVTRAMHPFRHLDKLEPGDSVILKDDSHTYNYSVIEQFIVSESDNWVMGQVPEVNYCLTLVTCHPVGSAKQRLILRAELTDIDGTTPQDFYSLQERSITDTTEDQTNIS